MTNTKFFNACIPILVLILASCSSRQKVINANATDFSNKAQETILQIDKYYTAQAKARRSMFLDYVASDTNCKSKFPLVIDKKTRKCADNPDSLPDDKAIKFRLPSGNIRSSVKNTLKLNQKYFSFLLKNLSPEEFDTQKSIDNLSEVIEGLGQEIDDSLKKQVEVITPIIDKIREAGDQRKKYELIKKHMEENSKQIEESLKKLIKDFELIEKQSEINTKVFKENLAYKFYDNERKNLTVNERRTLLSSIYESVEPKADVKVGELIDKLIASHKVIKDAYLSNKLSKKDKKEIVKQQFKDLTTAFELLIKAIPLF